jgi:hypothetical protein
VNTLQISRYAMAAAGTAVMLSVGYVSAGQPRQTVQSVPSGSSSVTITKVPPRGEGADTRGDIEGKVDGVENPASYKVVIYAHTNRWYIQPEADSPFTEIDVKGHWTNWTHLGYRYAVLVVRPGFKPPRELRALPEVKDDVVAKTEVAAASR